eukprot:TRINITY_DN9560_c0_g1_i1.p1 TRINITY_DN9560_c0_g1~~TRINITY_DN9560_c0_g1_i1.p1  ORF type:complete len:192 (-),score=63.66 TRINITY_DN9560_c0_g1_i1:46-621(-)
MSLLIPKDNIDRTKCMKLALVHDLAECLVGDITPYQGVSKEEKIRLEESAMIQLKDALSNAAGQEIFDLWREYENRQSEESKIVKELDRVEMLVQAYEYEKAQGIDLDPFFQSTEKTITEEFYVKLIGEIQRRRARIETTSSKDLEELKKELQKTENEMLEAANIRQYQKAAFLQQKLELIAKEIELLTPK